MATPPDRAPRDPEDPTIIDTAPSSSGSETSSPTASPTPNNPRVPLLPPLRSVSDPQVLTPMSTQSTPLGMLQNARRPNMPSTLSSGQPSVVGTALPQSMEAKMRAFQLSRQGTPPSRPVLGSAMSATASPPNMPGFNGQPVGGLPAGMQLPPNLRPGPHNFASAPVVQKAAPKPTGLSARRGMKLPGGLPGGPTAEVTPHDNTKTKEDNNSLFNKYSEYVDTKNGVLKFAGKAQIDGQGIRFTGGQTFNISLDEVDTLEELGKGNYGTVYKVRHARPRIRRPGLGLAGNKLSISTPLAAPAEQQDTTEGPLKGSTTGIVMAMKELRLELDEAKFRAIIMELDILHRCLSPCIIDFYGAFFQEGAVYICIEFMDGGSIDKLYGDGIPENVLRKITYSTTQGLKTLKDEHNIIHRDVKPTNILVNTRGQVKICDFGVSGNLVASIAKTNIGCQSYMAPERISGGGVSQANGDGGTYSVQSDIWSLGLTIIECALGRYPYPPETYNNIFSQLSAIVEGEPPDLPEAGFSELARDFVRGCLNKIPKLRPTYSMLLQHGWLAELSKPTTITEADEAEAEAEAGGNASGQALLGTSGTEDEEVAAWVKNALERKKKGLLGVSEKPALHAAPLNTVNPVDSPTL